MQDEDVYKRAVLHNDEQLETGKGRDIPPQGYVPGKLQCQSSVHVDDIKGAARRSIAESLLAHVHKTGGQCKADCDCFLHTGIQREHAAGVVFTHQCAYIESITPIHISLFTGEGGEAKSCTVFHEAYTSVFGVVIWTVLTRAELAVYM